jgi:glycyl-tRNA synthetase
MNSSTETTMDKLISLAKRRGFLYQGSEIYGGLAGIWDYGPLGVTLKNNIKNLWWKMFVEDREDMYGLDAAILMNQNVWKASGHVAGFADPLVDCKNCKNRFRVDNLISNAHAYFDYLLQFAELAQKDVKKTGEHLEDADSLLEYYSYIEGKPESEIKDILKTAEEDLKVNSKVISEIKKAKNYLGSLTTFYLNNHIKCPVCGKKNWSDARQFNMMFKTHVGAAEDDASVSYLRPETAQGIFANFKNVVDSFHPKLPFGIAQIGKAFRNEIAPGNFIFRLRELEQMEIEYFVRPEHWEVSFEHLRQKMHEWTKLIGLESAKVHELEIAPEDRAHYSMRTIDFEFDYPFGKKELYGLAYRTDFDLKAHMAMSSVDLNYLDEEGKTKFIPHVIEPSFGVDRTVLAVLANAYTEDELGGEKRVYLKLSPTVAPVKVAVFPLLKNKPPLVEKAREVYQMLRKAMPGVAFDDNGNIGKRYRRQDEIGTPWCVTVDFDSLEHEDVTVRDRDTGEQKRVKISELLSTLSY